MDAKVKQTVNLYYVLNFITNLGFALHFPIYVVFLLSRGLDLFEVNVVNAVYFIVVFLAEVPTGAVADIRGRKFSFVVSCFLLSVTMFVYGASEFFWGFVLAEVIAGIANAFSTGAFDAWVVDRLKYYNHSVRLEKIFSKAQQVNYAGSIIGALAGGFLADINMPLAWFVGGAILFAGGVVAFVFMKEEYFVAKRFSWQENFRLMKSTIGFSVRYLSDNEVVRLVVILMIFQSFAITAPNMQWQPFFEQFFVQKSALGFLFSGAILCLMIGARLAPRMLYFIKSKRKTLLFLQVVIGLGILFSPFFSVWQIALLFFLGHEMGRGAFYPVKKAWLHDNIPSQERATIMSFVSMLSRIGGTAGLLFSGFVAKNFSILTAWVISGSTLILSTLWVVAWYREKAEA